MQNNQQSFLDITYATIDNSEKTRKRTNYAIIVYVALFMIISAIIGLVVQLGYMAAKGYTLDQINPESVHFDPVITKDLMYFSGSFGNFVVYVIGLVVIGLIAGYMVIVDLRELKNIRFGKFVQYIVVGFAFFMICNYISGILQMIFGLTEEAGNEQAIVEILTSGTANFIFMSISVIILAPIVEEIVFRKCFFNLFSRRFNPLLTIIFSSLLFGAIHIISPFIESIGPALEDPSKWKSVIQQFLYLFIYSAMGVGLGLTYQYSKRNIIPVIILHMINNTISVLVTLLMPAM